MAPHSSTLHWKMTWTEEPGGLQSMGSLKSQTRLSNFTFNFHFHALEKEMATHSSVLAWRIPGTGVPGGLPPMRSHRIGHDWSDLAAAAAAAAVSLVSIGLDSKGDFAPPTGCCKEQYCIETWNIRSMNQGKLEVVKQEMARVNINILGISELKWTGMSEFNSDDHYIYYCGQESLRRNGVALVVNKRVQNAVLRCNLKNDRMNSVHF